MYFDVPAQYYARYCRDRKSGDWHDWPYMAGDGALQAADGLCARFNHANDGERKDRED